MNKKMICNREYFKVFAKSTKSRYLVEIENLTDKNLTILGDFEPLALKPLEKINIPKTENGYKIVVSILENKHKIQI